MKVFHVDVHGAVSQNGKSADCRGRIIGMQHKLGIFIQGTWRRVGAVRLYRIGARISTVMCVNRRQSWTEKVSHGGMTIGKVVFGSKGLCSSSAGETRLGYAMQDNVQALGISHS